MFGIAKVAGYMLSPLTIVLALGLLAIVFLAWRKPRGAAAAGVGAFLLLWVASLPALSNCLFSWLEDQYPARSVEATPHADAILVLGGALAGAWPPRRPEFNLGPSAGRVWHAAALYRAGKAPWVVISGGNQPGTTGEQPEADAIFKMLIVLGVPAQAIRREGTSRNTRENAANVLPILQSVGARRVLLVTSGWHMPRAVGTFQSVWQPTPMEIIPVSTDIQDPPPKGSLKVWLPSLDGLQGVTKSLKEFAGMVGLTIIRHVTP